MKFSGEENFREERHELWAHLIDVNLMSRTVPDLDRVEHMEPGLLVCRVRPRFSFLSGSLQLTFELVEERAPEMARFHIRSKGIGFAVVVETVVHLADREDGTALVWEGEITERSGLLKPVGRSLIQAAARKVIEGLWSGLHKVLDEA